MDLRVFRIALELNVKNAINTVTESLIVLKFIHVIIYQSQQQMCKEDIND